MEEALAEGTLEQLPDFLLQYRLTDRQRLSLSRIYPSLTGGEYLPDHLPGEVTIASIRYVDSVCRHVDEIRASLRGGYRWVGETWEGQEILDDEWTPFEEEGEAEDALPPKNFCQPVSQNPLVDWIVERVIEVLNDNNFNGGEEWDNLRGFASVSSRHYPMLAKQCAQMIENEIWDSARGDFQCQEIEDLTEQLESEVADL